MINVFQTHLVEPDQASAGQIARSSEGEYVQASCWLVQLMLELLRRGYGQNERFESMIKKLLKTHHYDESLLAAVTLDAPGDTLADRKCLANIIVEIVAEIGQDQQYERLIGTILRIAQTQSIALLAVNELLDNMNANICQTISVPGNAVVVLRAVSTNEVYLKLLADYINQLPQFCLKYTNAQTYLTLHAAMECLYNNFQSQPQYIDSCLKDIMISLLQLGDQYVVTPNIILKLLPYSYISAPYLSIYLPELFVNHPNVQAQACSYYFVIRKYGLQLAKG